MERKVSFCLSVLFGYLLIVSGGAARAGGLFDRTDFFTPSLRLSVESDDNIYTTTTNKVDDIVWGAAIKTSNKFAYGKNKQHLFLLDYIFGLRDSEERDETTTQNLDLSIRHKLTPRLKLSIRDKYLEHYRSELVEEGVITREKQDYTYNSASAALDCGLVRKLSTLVSYKNEFWDYDLQSSADAYNRTVDVVSASLISSITPVSSVRLGCSLRTADYDVAPDDYDSQLAFVGTTYHLSRIHSVIATAGYEARDYEADDGNDYEKPYANLNWSTILSEKSEANLGCSYAIQDTDNADYRGFVNQSVSGVLAYDFTPKISGTLRASHSLNTYEVELRREDVVVISEDMEEEGFNVGGSLTWRIRAWHFLALNYTHTDVESDFGDYDRNRVSLTWNGTF